MESKTSKRKKQSGITSHNRGATVKKWPAAQILTENEIKFILDDNKR